MINLRERTRLSRALNDIDIRIHSNLGSDEILQSALDGFVEALDADAGDIKLFEGDEWVVRYQRGFSADEVGLTLSIPNAPVAEEVRRLGEPVVISDYLGQDVIPFVGFPERHGLRSTIAVPLVARGKVTGALFAWMREPHKATEAEVDFARRMAASVALALENSRLYEAERAARERAEAAENRLELQLGRTQVLLKASDELTSTIDTDELMERLAHVVLEATGISRAFVNLIDMGRGVLIPKVATSGLNALAGEAIPLEDLSWTSFRAIQKRRTSLLDYDEPEIPVRDREIANANQARLVLFVPLLHRGEVTGHISLDEPGERYEFTPEQVRTVEGIAAIASIALENSRQYAREHRIAETLQQALITPPEPIDGIKVATVYQPASMSSRVGGDFYDVVELDGGHLALVVGDVAGKGIVAAQVTALMRDGIRAYLLESFDPAMCFTRLNTLAFRFTPVGKFATAFLGVLDRSDGAFQYCNAGHPSPLVVGEGGVRMLGQHCAILGAFEEVPYDVSVESLAPGEVFVAVTDGVTEARRGSELFGHERLADALKRLHGTPLEELPDALLSEVLEYAGGRLHDDVVIMCIARED